MREQISIIEVEGLAKTFKTREQATGLSSSLHSFIAPLYRQREAVKPISFSLEPGDLLAFIEQNGAGKSTTIKMLNCLQMDINAPLRLSKVKGG